MVLEIRPMFSNLHYDREWTHFLEKYVLSGILFPILAELYSPIDFNYGTASNFHLSLHLLLTPRGDLKAYICMVTVLHDEMLLDK